MEFDLLIPSPPRSSAALFQFACLHSIIGSIAKPERTTHRCQAPSSPQKTVEIGHALYQTYSFTAVSTGTVTTAVLASYMIFDQKHYHKS